MTLFANSNCMYMVVVVGEVDHFEVFYRRHRHEHATTIHLEVYTTTTVPAT
jgi:hypothetical protein